MTGFPLALRYPTIDTFRSGVPLRLRRPLGGMYRGIEPGDLLWIREPYRLLRKFSSLSPTAAAGYDARPYFAADLASGDIDRLDLGVLRPARALLRKWHRFHAHVRSVETQDLHRISLQEVRDEGFTSLASWRARWDADISSFTSKRDPRLWDRNPTVLVIELEPVLKPLPAQLEAPPRSAMQRDLETAGGLAR